ncbi:RNA polymerase sigma factor [Aureliella helgolandensis]|uniref:RNA polymerase sigma factor RpoE n=1 Tax=Aureliella helgolandensis TaxID=2527968 RepID=A0A518GBP1_9BACT|nr:sigma-70 family RNA polymerase sigma factor [Aureliella helgolandensis]QDV26036.1 RNA polymerase sigma factor RpoE [Aureliella helgolandensis]
MESQADTSASDEELELRAWDGDESVQAELVLSLSAPLERAMIKKYGLNTADAEDVVADGIRIFWQIRERYDPSQSLKAFIYRIVDRIALKLVSGHLRWQKARNLETQVDDTWLAEIAAAETAANDGNLKDGEPTKPLCQVVQRALDTLNELERLVIEAYARAGDEEVKAAELGVELGKQRDGVPIPEGTIRQNKRRAIAKIEAELMRQGYNPSTGALT